MFTGKHANSVELLSATMMCAPRNSVRRESLRLKFSRMPFLWQVEGELIDPHYKGKFNPLAMQIHRAAKKVHTPPLAM